MKRFSGLLGLSVLCFIMMGSTVFADIIPEKQVVQMAQEGNLGIILIGAVLVLVAIVLIIRIRGKKK